MKAKLLTLISVLSIFFVGCDKEDEQKPLTYISVNVAYEDKTIGAPSGRLLLFDATLDDLESHYLIKAQDIFALVDKEGEYILQKPIPSHMSDFEPKKGDTHTKVVYFPDSFYQDFPKKMLLYLYVEAPFYDYQTTMKQMYTFFEVEVGSQDYHLDKVFPSIPNEYGGSLLHYVE